MVRASLPQLRNTPVGKRLEMKINEIDGEVDNHNLSHIDGHDDAGETHTEVDDNHDHEPSFSTSTSASDVLSGSGEETPTSLTEDTGVTSSEADLLSPESRPKSVIGVDGVGKSKNHSHSRRENEELENLLQ
jgi:hypothetical protein